MFAVVKDLKGLSEQDYPNLNTFHSENITWFNERTIITPKNDTAASINDSLLDQLPTKMEITEIYKIIKSVQWEKSEFIIKAFGGFIMSVNKKMYITVVLIRNYMYFLCTIMKYNKNHFKEIKKKEATKIVSVVRTMESI